ncbi:MAG: chitobiase/beta-hexosaminidase C-terminal domain-containing protein [Lachnospiraceae bacterium]|nr:chitobiase/beta-hexosaminidase C-terminal domain-containing protein [Lachnospiraceae bacterium]
MKNLLKKGKMQIFVCRLLMLALIFGEMVPTLKVKAFDGPEEEVFVEEEELAGDEDEAEAAEEAADPEEATAEDEAAEAPEEGSEEQEPEAADPADEETDAPDDASGEEAAEENDPAEEEEEVEPGEADGADVGVVFDVTYGQTEARKVSVSVNSMRKNKSVDELTYDYGLEEKAILRATELSLVYGYGRPNGSSYNTAFPKEVAESGVQELITCGGKNAEEVLKRWLSSEGDSEKLLSKDYKYYAIGHVVVDEQNYWAVEYSKVLIKKDKTAANDKKKQEVTMALAEDKIQELKVTPSLAEKSTINIDYNKATKLPTFTVKLAIKDHAPAGRDLPIKNSTLKWALEDSTLAKIENNTTITGLKDRGDTTLKATLSACGKSKTLTYNVHTIIHPTAISVEPKTAKLDLDEELQLHYTIEPADCDNKNVIFKADPSNPGVSVTQKGLVRAMTAGTAKISVETEDKGIKAYCTVTVEATLSVAMPQLSPVKDFYHTNDPIRLSSVTPNAKIYYTLDGSEPAYELGTLYTDPFTLNDSCLIKAIACKELLQADGTTAVVSSNVLTASVAVFPEDWGDVTEEDRAQWTGFDELPDGLWIAKATLPEPVYNGKAQKPDSFHVYYHNVRLQNKKDYTVSFKNNVNAGNASAVFSFKGNLDGKGLVREFTIKPADIAEASVASASGIYNGSVLAPKLSVRWNKKTLKEGTDYTVTADRELKDAGEYTLTVNGRGNFAGSAECAFYIIKTGEKLDLSKAKVSKIPAQKFLEESYTSVAQLKDKKGNPFNLTVKVGSDVLSTADYETTILGGDKVGTAVLRITPAGSRTSGYKDVNFKISGTDVKKAVYVAKIPDRIYTGFAQEPVPVITSKTGMAIPEGAITISYSKNVNAGTAKLILTGVPEKGYSGSMSVRFKIKKPKVDALLASGLLELSYLKETVYEKGGVKTAVRLRYKVDGGWTTLTEGTDYTVKYGNNKKAGSEGAGKTAPWFMIVGKKNFAGKSAKQYFTIEEKNLSQLDAYAPDVLVGGNYRVTPVVTDTNGKKLTFGTDLDKELMRYRYLENCKITRNGKKDVTVHKGDEIGKDDIIPEGTALEVAIHAKDGSGYTGVVTAKYKVVKADLSKASGSIPDQRYTGEEILLNKNQITLTISGIPVAADQFEIASYENNIKVGTAKVTLVGKNGYGGMKVLNFRIVKAPAGNWKAGVTFTE